MSSINASKTFKIVYILISDVFAVSEQTKEIIRLTNKEGEINFIDCF